MHRFHQSRGRIFFEVLCALAISASFAVTWDQTGASAMLPAAAVALLYALVHAFDMAGRRVPATEPQPVEIATEPPIDDPVDWPMPEAAAVQPMTDDHASEVTELAEPAPPPVRKARQPKSPRKTSNRRAAAPKDAEVAEPVAAEQPEIEHVPDEEPVVVEPMPFDEAAHASVTPLFEPEPFVRQQRTVFGRKAG